MKHTLTPYDLQLYLETIAINVGQSGTDITLEVDNESEGSFRCMVDLWLMEGVVGNILSNAREHGLDSRPIKIFLAHEGTVASIRILNEGPTIC